MTLIEGDSGNLPQTLTDQVYGQIREDILGGILAPGARLRVEPLKARYGMGASPIREALSRLTGDGLVRIQGRRGFTVAEITLEELADITETRVTLETQALKSSIEHACNSGEGDRWEAGVVASFHRLAKLDGQLRLERPTQQWEERHGEFHEALVAACPYERLQHFRRLLFDQSERYRRLSLSDTAVGRDVSAEHRELMEAALAYNAERAATLLACHIRRTSEIVAGAVRLRDQRGGPGAGDGE